MKIHGYCERCHRFRRVTVSPPFLIGGIPVGICDECEETNDGN